MRKNIGIREGEKVMKPMKIFYILQNCQTKEEMINTLRKYRNRRNLSVKEV